MTRHRHAFTLIELLIVTAIIAIISGALIATLIAPLKEQAATDLDAEMQRGSMVFFARLTEDVHCAGALQIEEDSSRLTVQPAFEKENRILYFVSDDSTLRRWEGIAEELPAAGAEPPGLGAPLVPSVEQLQFTRAADGASTMTARLLARREAMQQMLVVDRSLTLLTDQAWRGGQP